MVRVGRVGPGVHQLFGLSRMEAYGLLRNKAIRGLAPREQRGGLEDYALSAHHAAARSVSTGPLRRAICAKAFFSVRGQLSVW